MPIFPVTKFEIRSSAKPAEIAALLSTHVKPSPAKPRLFGAPSFFEGSVSEKSFRLIRINYNRRNIFEPCVCGDFRLVDGITIIDVTVEYDLFLFLLPPIIWFVASGWFIFQVFLLPFLEAIYYQKTTELLRFLSISHMILMLAVFGFSLFGFSIIFINGVIQIHLARETLEKFLAPIILK